MRLSGQAGGLRYNRRMVALLHAPVLLALIALQFHAAGLDQPSSLWRFISRALTYLAIPSGFLLFLWGGMLEYRASFACSVIAFAGTARHRKMEGVIRWFRWLELASWCLCILAVCGAISSVLVFRKFDLK